MNNKIDLVSGWDKLWGSIVSAGGQQVMDIATVIGVVLLVFAIGKYVWARRTGRGNTNDVTFSAFFGMLLAAPQFVVPLVLFILDLILNVLIGLVSGVVH